MNLNSLRALLSGDFHNWDLGEQINCCSIIPAKEMVQGLVGEDNRQSPVQKKMGAFQELIPNDIA